MAWIEKVGEQAFRVRWRNGDGTTLSLSGFRSRTAAKDFASDMATDRRRGVWLDPAGAAMPVAEWADRWVQTLDVEARTEENYRGRLRNHILPQWGNRGLGEITASEVTSWFKQLRGHRHFDLHGLRATKTHVVLALRAARPADRELARRTGLRPLLHQGVTTPRQLRALPHHPPVGQPSRA